MPNCVWCHFGMCWICNIQNVRPLHSLSYILAISQESPTSHGKRICLKDPCVMKSKCFQYFTLLFSKIVFSLKHSASGSEILYTSLLNTTFMHIINRFVEKHHMNIIWTRPAIAMRNEYVNHLNSIMNLNNFDAITKHHFWLKQCNTAISVWIWLLWFKIKSTIVFKC